MTGDVILGSIGSHDRRDYTAVGNQVNLCSRLSAIAGPREILIADSTFMLVRDMVKAEKRESIAGSRRWRNRWMCIGWKSRAAFDDRYVVDVSHEGAKTRKDKRKLTSVLFLLVRARRIVLAELVLVRN